MQKKPSVVSYRGKLVPVPAELRIMTKLALFDQDGERGRYWWDMIHACRSEHFTESYLMAFARFILWEQINLDKLSIESVTELQMKGYI